MTAAQTPAEIARNTRIVRGILAEVAGDNGTVAAVIYCAREWHGIPREETTRIMNAAVQAGRIEITGGTSDSVRWIKWITNPKADTAR